MVRQPARTAAAGFSAEQLYSDGETVGWQTTVSVLPSPGPSAPSEQHLGRAVVAGLVGLAGLALVGASLAVLHRVRRRRSLQDA